MLRVPSFIQSTLNPLSACHGIKREQNIPELFVHQLTPITYEPLKVGLEGLEGSSSSHHFFLFLVLDSRFLRGIFQNKNTVKVNQPWCVRSHIMQKLNAGATYLVIQ